MQSHLRLVGLPLVLWLGVLVLLLGVLVLLLGVLVLLLVGT